jgi:hypothetical protein
LEGRVCFPDLNAPKRTDEDFILKSDEDYHLGSSELEKITNFGLVTNVPIDYMHLVCLGVTRKMLYLWLTGDLRYRLNHFKVKCISEKLEYLRSFIPCEFGRKPRSLEYLKLWKVGDTTSGDED